MFSRSMGSAVAAVALVLAALAGAVLPAFAQAARDRLRIPVGRAEVVSSTDEVRTVAIAEPKIADAAVGSSRTVVVNGKSPGVTTLVVYNEGARYKVYDVEVYVPNGQKQVALHVRVAEVNDNAKRELGFDFFGDGFGPSLGGGLFGGLYTTKVSEPSVPLIIPPAAGSRADGLLQYDHGSGTWGLQTKWRALEESGDLRTLATPTVVARSGQQASFLAGGELPVPIASSATAGQSNVTIEWKEFGVRLNFTPTVEEDNSITLKVAPELSQLDFSNPLSLSGFVIPSLVSRKTSTTVSLHAGEHLVISGLKQTEKIKVVRRIPVLGYIPVLGFFFSNTRAEKVERDLLVVVSPEILEQASSSLPALPTDPKEGK
jgi:pilus assembly protein CpaC